MHTPVEAPPTPRHWNLFTTALLVTTFLGCAEVITTRVDDVLVPDDAPDAWADAAPDVSAPPVDASPDARADADANTDVVADAADVVDAAGMCRPYPLCYLGYVCPPAEVTEPASPDAPDEAPVLSDVRAVTDGMKTFVFVAGRDVNGDAEYLRIEAMDPRGGAVTLPGEPSRSVRTQGVRFEGYGDFATTAPARVRVVVTDRARRTSEAVTLDVTPQPVRALDEDCDFWRMRDRCVAGAVCRATEVGGRLRCLPENAPRIVGMRLLDNPIDARASIELDYDESDHQTVYAHIEVFDEVGRRVPALEPVGDYGTTALAFRAGERWVTRCDGTLRIPLAVMYGGQSADLRSLPPSRLRFVVRLYDSAGFADTAEVVERVPVETVREGERCDADWAHLRCDRAAGFTCTNTGRCQRAMTCPVSLVPVNLNDHPQPGTPDAWRHDGTIDGSTQFRVDPCWSTLDTAETVHGFRAPRAGRWRFRASSTSASVRLIAQAWCGVSVTGNQHFCTRFASDVAEERYLEAGETLWLVVSKERRLSPDYTLTVSATP